MRAADRELKTVKMTLKQATKLVGQCFDQMNANYRSVVFDEWAIVSLNDNRGLLLAYSGPRKEDFQKNFVADAGALRASLLRKEHGNGDFEFARHSAGTAFESFLVLGPAVFLICNNTRRTMDEITGDPKWLSAQVPFVELSEEVRDNPLLA